MDTRLTLGDSQIPYVMRKSRRARTIRLQISSSGMVITTPYLMPHWIAVQFARSKARWILRHWAIMQNKEPISALHLTNSEFIRLRQTARKQFEERVLHFNAIYGFSYVAVRVGNQRSLWGSCSRRGILRFNIRLMKVKSELLDYVVVHELCHLEEHNHGKRFWSLVAQVIPNHKELRKELRGYRLQ